MLRSVILRFGLAVVLGCIACVATSDTTAQTPKPAEHLEIVPNVSRVEMPPRTSGLPHPGAVVR